MLATPLTVCLVVLGKHIPEMEFITVLLADQPAMDPDVSYYQRLLAMDSGEATEIVDEYLKTHSLEAVYDDVILPALTHAQTRSPTRSAVGRRRTVILQATRDIVDELGASAPERRCLLRREPAARAMTPRARCGRSGSWVSGAR